MDTASLLVVPDSATLIQDSAVWSGAPRRANATGSNFLARVKPDPYLHTILAIVP